MTTKAGRLELADQGTLFLDEVGDIPLELQPKLLRALQEREFERLGSTHMKKVDVRLIAATNCDLNGMIAEKKFRSDLYYRLNVFPIRIPPLRERRDDIPFLVRHFTEKYARLMGKEIQTISGASLRQLIRWHWPGNIRELENLLERAVLLSPGKELRIPLSEIRSSSSAGETPSTSTSFSALTPGASAISTLEEAERQHILRALRQTEWRIAGVKGAAALLGMKRTTLQARMRKLGIRRPI